jgi:hypothetical protein
MQFNLYCSVFIVILATQTLHAQNFEKLSALENKSIRVYHSEGQVQRATIISERVEKAIRFHDKLVQFRPTVTLLVLSAADWSSFTDFPVYGMPHYTDQQTLIVAAEDNPYWKSMVPPLERLPAALRTNIETTYRNANGELSMQPFFDLLALHELGHAFHKQGGLNMQRNWMGELFCNILLHTYIAENEPEQLSALTVFPNMVIAGGSKEYKYTALQDIEERYQEIGKNHARNYGWYQCRWHKSAADIYEAGGKELVLKLWTALQQQKTKLTNDELLLFLDKAGAKPVADMVRNW